MSPHTAFAQLSDGRIMCGKAPFSASSAPPDGISCFYWNDFTLSDPEPWKVPQGGIEIFADSQALARSENAGAKTELVGWEPLPEKEFAEIFGLCQARIGTGDFQKVVPVAVGKGRLRNPVGSCLPLPEISGRRHRLYGLIGEDAGQVGATPEILFSQNKGRLDTMALAGTASGGSAEKLLADAKQIHEHEVVVSALLGRLKELGNVVSGEREAVDLETLCHLRTRIHVELDGVVPVADLVTLLHPTPAVGAAPWDVKSATFLGDIRGRAAVPASFGAPFGFCHDGVCDMLVAIRCVYWDQNLVRIPAGCGVVPESQLGREWEEVQLKIEAVRHFFSL